MLFRGQVCYCCHLHENGVMAVDPVGSSKLRKLKENDLIFLTFMGYAALPAHRVLAKQKEIGREGRISATPGAFTVAFHHLFGL
jgi:hypothetical protein